jgi:hypothetical protein
MQGKPSWYTNLLSLDSLHKDAIEERDYVLELVGGL